MTEDKYTETEAYLAQIRRTISESARLVETARLRIAETDRMLESQGLTREQVMRFNFTDAQREAVNRELVRQGMAPLEDESKESGWIDGGAFVASPGRSFYSEAAEAGRAGEELAERQRKFGMMMKPFQI